MIEIEQLSYADRMKLVESIVRSLRLGEHGAHHEDPKSSPEVLFGMWRDRDVTLEKIREKAWRRP
jgi:hypothetical protein